MEIVPLFGVEIQILRVVLPTDEILKAIGLDGLPQAEAAGTEVCVQRP